MNCVFGTSNLWHKKETLRNARRGVMRAVAQRVRRASVTVEGRVVGAIDAGLLVLLAVHRDDGPGDTAWMADKLVNLRVFGDDEGRMNRSVADIGGEILLVSQFTLYGDCRKGRRPSFIDSAPPEKAEPMYRALIEAVESRGVRCASGVFGAMMDVELVNDGPVTLIIESERHNQDVIKSSVKP